MKLSVWDVFVLLYLGVVSGCALDEHILSLQSNFWMVPWRAQDECLGQDIHKLLWTFKDHNKLKESCFFFFFEIVAMFCNAMFYSALLASSTWNTGFELHDVQKKTKPLVHHCAQELQRTRGKYNRLITQQQYWPLMIGGMDRTTPLLSYMMGYTGLSSIIWR